MAFSKSPLAFLVGMIFGGFVPVATWLLMKETLTPWRIGMIVGGGMFSAITVYQCAKAVFRSAVRAFTFALLVESTMLLAETSLISVAALALLVAINSTSSAVHLLREDATLEMSHGFREGASRVST